MKIHTMASGIRSWDGQMSSASTDAKAKNIQSKITDAQQQMQRLSSKEELTADEKAAERKKLQKEILGLNNKLKQHQEDLRRSQKREMLAKERQEEAVSAKEQRTERKESGIFKNRNGVAALQDETDEAEKLKETDEKDSPEKLKKTDKKDKAGLSDKKVHALISANGSVQQAGQVGTVILRTKDGIVILKGEIEQDRRYGSDTKQKQEELAKRRKRMQKAEVFQSSVLHQAHNTLKSAAKSHQNASRGNGRPRNENNTLTSTLRSAAAEQASQSNLQVSFH